MTKKLATACLLLTFLGFTSPCFAQDAKITESLVRKFYDDNMSSYKGDYSHFVSFFKDHFHPDFTATRYITFHLSGQVAIPIKNVVNKTKLLESLPLQYKDAEGSTLVHEITKLQVAPDGESAYVEDKSLLKGAHNHAPDGSSIQINSTGTCADRFSLAQGRLQLLKSTCYVDVIQIAEEKP